LQILNPVGPINHCQWSTFSYLLWVVILPKHNPQTWTLMTIVIRLCHAKVGQFVKFGHLGHGLIWDAYCVFNHCVINIWLLLCFFKCYFYYVNSECIIFFSTVSNTTKFCCHWYQKRVKLTDWLTDWLIDWLTDWLTALHRLCVMTNRCHSRAQCHEYSWSYLFSIHQLFSLWSNKL
jgi:hypothetical protein